MNVEQNKHELSDRKLPDLSKQICVFSLNEEDYGIPIQWVLEILEPKWLTKIPRSPEVVVGAMNHHGKIFTILDMAILFDNNQNPISRSNVHILLIKESEIYFGFLLRRISEITYYQDDVLKQGFENLDKKTNPFVKAIFRFENRIINIIEIPEIIKQFSNIIGSR